MKLILLSLVFSQAMAENLTLESYKKMVMEKDPATQAAFEKKKGAELAQDSAQLLTGVSLFASGGYLDDQRPTTNPQFQGYQTKVSNYSLGLQQQTRLGLKWSLSQNASHTEINGANTSFLPVPNYYDVYPKIELTMPLWRNLLGSETTGDVDQMHYQAQALAKQAEVNWIQRQNDVEAAFYKLLSEQEAYKIHQDSLERAKKILSWTELQIKRGLLDANDVYQAKAAVAQRQIDVVNSETSLRETARSFNSLRGVEGDQVAEKLLAPELNLNQLHLNSSDHKTRLDTLAQKDLNLSSEAGYRSQKEKNKPNLDLTLQAYTQGRSPQYPEAQDNTFKKKDYLYVGLNFVMPLDQSKASHSRSGFAALEKSQMLSEKARLRDQSLTWDQTVDAAQSLAQQVQLVRELETFQRKKADAEREKLKRGRSTTFQVLSFEQDYNSIRSQRIQLELQARQFINSLALFQ